jgi:hypothetical protein
METNRKRPNSSRKVVSERLNKNRSNKKVVGEFFITGLSFCRVAEKDVKEAEQSKLGLI